MRCVKPCAPRTASRHRRQAGVAVIMALLTVALVAGVAAALMADYGNAVSQLSGRRDQTQSQWLARGAIDWARNVLEDDFRRGGANNIDHLREEWTVKVPPTPVDEGELSGEILDMSGRFNLNSVVTGGAADTRQLAIFVRLLQHAGIDGAQATQLGNALVDWVDSDQEIVGPGGAEDSWYRSQPRHRITPKGYLVDVSELLNVRGFDRAIVDALRPHVAALPAATRRINVNTASAEVIAAHAEGMSLADARAMVTSRERAYFTSRDNFISQLPKNTSSDASQFEVRSEFFLATGRARWGSATTRMEVLLKRSQARPDILWFKLL